MQYNQAYKTNTHSVSLPSWHLSLHQAGARLVGTGLLKSKEERLRWERMFANEFITPVIQVILSPMVQVRKTCSEY